MNIEWDGWVSIFKSWILVPLLQNFKILFYYDHTMKSSKKAKARNARFKAIFHEIMIYKLSPLTKR